jgi:hypothetical protein
VLLNSKRVAPYVLMIFFAGNAVLWWAKGPAVALGWATNSEYYRAQLNRVLVHHGDADLQRRYHGRFGVQILAVI